MNAEAVELLRQIQAEDANAALDPITAEGIVRLEPRTRRNNP